jgi:hypothetical protein
MGLLGRYIDGLTDEQRDRIVEAQAWGAGGGGLALVNNVAWPNADGLVFGCLVEYAHGGNRAAQQSGAFLTIGPRFDVTVHRFGLDRVVRAVKLRAGSAPLEQELETWTTAPTTAPTMDGTSLSLPCCASTRG